MTADLLTTKEKSFLKNLAGLLDFGASLFNEITLNQGSSHYKYNFLVLTHAAIHNYNEAIYVLCRDARPHAAIVLLRSVFEAHLNMHYLLNTNSNKRLALYVVKDAQDRVRTARSFLDLLEKHPHWEGKYRVTTKTVLKDMISKNEAARDEARRANKLNPKEKLASTLLERAREYDKKVASKNKGGEMEFNYNLIYRMFSTYAHLTPTGIERFFKELPDGSKEFYLGQAPGVEPILTTTFAWYLGLLEYLKNWGVLPKSVKLTGFKRMRKQMNVSLDEYGN